MIRQTEQGMAKSAAADSLPNVRGGVTPVLSRARRLWDVAFLLIMTGLAGSFVLLIVLLLLADLLFTSFSAFTTALQQPEILAAFQLTMKTCTAAAVLSVWAAVPLGYMLSRYSFPGRQLIDVIVDIPIVLPPLVLGLSLLILFHQPLPGTSWVLDRWLQERLGFAVTYRWPAVVLAQFAVACAFAVRTMRVTFDQIHPRAEQVARTLGCSRAQAFLLIALPQAWRGIITAFTIAWARSLGEFGPILVFAGATRQRTEVLSTSVFLELSVGQLDAAVAVSLLMVAMAVVVLVILRSLGAGLST
jgi:molybdate transport system permease protein